MDDIQSYDSQFLVTQVTAQKNPSVNKLRGRLPRGKASLVAYKEKVKKNNQDKVNKKRTYKQTSPDLKRYNFKRNKKLDSIRDVCDNTTWLTGFYIYLFFELLHKQSRNINGMCDPVQIKLYTGSL
ncbi:unnamed protein product [Didymodactylos carnosus]|uniref:Uncharacterized protein n=1 Tax=Didymodactylos carnosus TaxID=1234261 RepID=A0A814BEP2_9BILA|nr:unnamed protein product [Didymodactylos carnosus]CAF1070488.1 unnamed protein product [Didymodactylos carnosus]CAF3705067.1 unnamed protein product [Didymodactylos carnosus]CAF3834895.1 unnamed protein product [Didymodactylos carnosus]